MAVTVQDFIVNYNYTFLFLHERFGKKAVESLWKRIEEVFCEELRCVVAEGGLIGAMDYFYGEDGITAREMPQGAHGATEDFYFERFDHCPSVNEMVKRGKERYPYYCEHCQWLYERAFRENGFEYKIEYGLQSRDVISDRCMIRAWKSGGDWADITPDSRKDPENVPEKDAENRSK